MKIIDTFALVAAASALLLALVIPEIVEPVAAMAGILAIFWFDLGRSVSPIRMPGRLFAPARGEPLSA